MPVGNGWIFLDLDHAAGEGPTEDPAQGGVLIRNAVRPDSATRAGSIPVATLDG